VTTPESPSSILLVDHSRGSLAFQETILRRRGVTVMTALSGTEGVRKAKEELPHLIIFGWDLFDMTAPEFCREIRNDDDTKTISLLLIADRSEPEQGDLCLSAGCNDVIFRPLQRRELDAKVARLTSIPVRRSIRTITKIEVSLERNGRFLLARSINISSTGMLLEVDKVLSSEGPIRLQFYLPGDPKPMQVDAEILRAEFSGTMAKYGLRFMNTGVEERERIEHFVHRLRSRELI
jgi:two-component system, OmpR family, alkaline phosphatase synthesis response regulator PhoP